MKFIFGLIVGLSAISLQPKSSLAEDDLLILASLCESNSPCIEMTLDHGENFKPGIKEEIEDGVLYRFKVKGRLDGQPIKTHEVEFFAGTAEMACTDFVQGNVAVSGWTKEGPILQTYQGQLHVLGGELKVGCEDCLEIKQEETQKTLASYRTPSWDLTLTGLEAEQLTYDDQNKAYLLTKTKCLSIPTYGMIEVANLKKCEPTQNVGHFSRKYKEFKLKAGEWLYKRNGHSHVAKINNESCS